MADPLIYHCNSLTGGTAGSLDAISKTIPLLEDGAIAYTVTSSNIKYVHRYNAASTAVESSPGVIAPDDGGTGRWEQVSDEAGGIPLHTHADSTEGGKVNFINGISKVGAGSAVLSLAGGAPTEWINIDITAFGFSVKPWVGFIQLSAGPERVIVVYASDISTVTTAHCLVQTTLGGSLPAGPYRFSFLFVEI